MRPFTAVAVKLRLIVPFKGVAAVAGSALAAASRSASTTVCRVLKVA